MRTGLVGSVVLAALLVSVLCIGCASQPAGVTCSTCQGSGEVVDIMSENPQTETCPTCDGTGRLQ